MRRRALLVTTGNLLATLNAGCLDGISGTCSNTVELRLVPVTETDAQNKSVIRFTSLPNSQQEIVDETVRTGQYTECYPPSDGFSGLRERVRQALNSQPNPDALVYAVIERDGEYYGVYLRVEDVVDSQPPRESG